MVNDEPQSPPPRLTPESAKALADQTIDAAVLPKKIPDVDDIEGQKRAVVGALSHALLFATEMPISTLQPLLEPIAEYVIALGIRQTEHIDPAADAIKAPAWVVDGMRDKAMKVPEQPNLVEAEPVVARTAEAPKCPKKIAHHARAVRR
jgi:hypothetical protein